MEGQMNRWVDSRKEWLGRRRIGREENTSPNARRSERVCK